MSNLKIDVNYNLKVFISLPNIVKATLKYYKMYLEYSRC